MFLSAAELGLPAPLVLCKVEDELQQLYLQVHTHSSPPQHDASAQSCILAEYLLSVEFMNLQSIASTLDLDPCDIPLLLVGPSLVTVTLPRLWPPPTLPWWGRSLVSASPCE